MIECEKINYQEVEADWKRSYLIGSSPILIEAEPSRKSKATTVGTQNLYPGSRRKFLLDSNKIWSLFNSQTNFQISTCLQQKQELMMPHGAQDKVQKANITIHNACLILKD